MATKKTRKTRKRKTAATMALGAATPATLGAATTQYQIFIGTVPYSKVCIGDEEFKAIYRGSELIWKRKD